jgi:SAM-dependent methyltransferase
MYEQRVKAYYARCVRKEWNRLFRNAYNRLEFETTLHFLEKYLPKRGRILDAGGGPGRYTIELARRGYDVTLLDLVPANLEFAERQIRRARLQSRVPHIIAGSITDLSRFPDNTFDAVVCLGGPLSHVLDRRQRAKAVRELVRVARQGAPLFVSVISRFGTLVVELGPRFQHEIEERFFRPLRDTGDYPGGSGFTACHFFLPEEFRDAFSSRGVKVLELAGLQGLSSHHAREVNELARHPKRWRVWIETHYLTCTHPSAVGISEHMLMVCRKNRS